MKLETVKIADLKNPETNVRKHPEKQVLELARSVEQFGQIRPFVIDEDNVVWAGNGLLAAMRHLGRETAEAYRVTNLSDTQKKKLMLADNKVYFLGIDDLVGIETIMGELEDFDIPGYDAGVLEQLYGDEEEAVVEDIMGYGTASAEKVQEINQAAERQARIVEEAEELAPAPAPAPVVTEDGEVKEVPAVEYESKETVAQYVICPKCGEKIWV